MSIFAAGCGGDDSSAALSPAEMALARTLGPLPALAADPTNRWADDPRAATLGQRLFFEAGHAGPLSVGNDGVNGSLGAVGETQKVACASCHIPATWFMDTRSHPNATSLGAAWTARNAPSLVDAAHYRWFGWGGAYDSQWMQATVSHEVKADAGGGRLEYAHVVFRKYRADYDALFPVPLDPALSPAAPDAARFPAAGRPKAAASDPDGPWELMSEADRRAVETIISNGGKAIAAYERLLIAGPNALDRFLGGDAAALSASELRGLRLFIGKANCIGCHSGPILSDHAFHNSGVLQAVGASVPASDSGHLGDARQLLAATFNGAGRYSDDAGAGQAKLTTLGNIDDAAAGRFRTKGLRNVAMTAPYMHNGSLATLEAVVDFYDQGGAASGFAGSKDPLMVPLNLTPAEKADLVAFLRALTGTPVPEALRADTSAR